jgi:alpha-L-rhamnosidase
MKSSTHRDVRSDCISAARLWRPVGGWLVCCALIWSIAQCFSAVAIAADAATKTSPSVVATAPTGLTCELLTRPELTRITNPKPALGWIVPRGNAAADRAGQSAYRILVSSSEDRLSHDAGDDWDSGQVKTSNSINVEYAGKPLAAGETYFWKVRTWNLDGQPSDWSTQQRFIVAADLEKYETARYPLETREIPPVRIEKIAADRYFVDFGKAAFGYLRLNTALSDAGKELTVHFGEKLKSPSVIDRAPGGTIRYAQTNLKLGSEHTACTVHPPVDKRNTSGAAIRLPESIGAVIPFRYVELENFPGDLQADAIRQVAVHYPFDDNAATFSCSDERLNRIWDLCKHTIKATTFAGIYVDGDRERIPYEADAYLNQLGHYAVDREYALARYTHEYLLAHPTWPTEWKHHSILMAWADYLYTGNRESLEHNYARLQKKTLEERARADGLLQSNRQQIMRDDIVDWPTAERDGFVHTPVNAVVNAFYYRSLCLMGKIADALGKSDDADRYNRMAGQVRESFNATLFDTKRGLYVDGEGTNHASQHANLFALAFSLVPDERKPAVVEIVKSKDMACSVYGAQYLLEALYESGEADHGFDLMTAPGERGWLHMLDLGSTMTLEAWDIKFKPNLDWNHAWGTAPLNIISRYVVGVRPMEPGFGKVQIQPQLGPLEWVEATVPTIRGPIHVRCDRAGDGKFEAKISLPANMTARIGLPIHGTSPTLTVNGRAETGVVAEKTVWIDCNLAGESTIAND